MVYTAESVDFDNFMPVDAGYGPREISAEAAFVTEHNIGQWSLEFEKDLQKDDNGKVCFYFSAAREPEAPIHLKMESGVWIIKIWGELHIFEDGMFQKTFDVPKEQLRAVRMANHRKTIELEEQYQKELAEERAEFEKEFDERLKQAADSGDWSSLTKQEEYVLRMRLADDDEIRALKAAAVERASKKEPVRPLSNRPESEYLNQKTVGKDYHAGSLYRSEGQDPDFYEKDAEQTQFVPQVSIPLGPPAPGELMKDWKKVEEERIAKEPIYPEGDEPMTNRQKVDRARDAFLSKADPYKPGDEPKMNREQVLSNEEIDRASKAPVTEVWGTDQQ